MLLVAATIAAFTRSRAGRAHALATAEHLHLVGADFGRVFVNAALICPLAGTQAAFHVNLRPFT